MQTYYSYNYRSERYRWFDSNPVRLILNLLWVYICYEICRLAFIFENWSLYSANLSWHTFWTLSLGGWRFDTSAIFYTNSLVILLYLFPFHFKEKKWFWMLTKLLYVIINTACIIMNFADSVFFEFRKHRTSMAIFQEFKGDNNLGGIVGSEIAGHWYLVILTILMTIFLWKCYRKPGTPVKPLKRYYLTQVISLIVMTPLAIFGMRGNTFFTATRPISVNYAHKYASEPIQTGIVLNTPFSIIRTVNQMAEKTPILFKDEAALSAVYSPVHVPADSLVKREKNIVILIVESFAQEFVGALNKDLDNGTYKGYTPFTDSLLQHSMYFEQSFANGGFSIDALPAVIASIPRMDRPFVLSPHSLNHINSLASEVKKMGYSTAFFHGADNESLGFNAFIKQAGVDRYFGKNEFVADPRFGGMKEFDGKWGIWDEPFLQFFCAELSEMPQPFMASIFTLSSHHPFAVPEKYKDVFVDEGLHKLHKCIRYADYSIKRFFESARKQPWFDNTIFIITADHASSKRTHEVYFGEVGGFRIPIIFYDPSGELPQGRQPGIVQQMDIMPTMLNYLGYDKPYIAFGKDVLNTPVEDMWAFNWDFYPQYFKGDYVMRMENQQISEIYNYKKDPLLKENLKGKMPKDIEQDMFNHMCALIQSYMQRMDKDEVSIKHE
ncbi:alkaline phosphatase family protein [uncultured Duncaniella sp.]|uniref:LTA synthase family protein n=1 Tax=uncultured Duncaniella sp. TaxID=2768039 RepID=UPI0025A9A42C|nr:alkaline phosphatase family protein [uncultured Duncaniella sp.]